MSNYLFVGDHRIRFDNSMYPGRIKFSEGPFYVDVACIKPKSAGIPLTYQLSDCFELRQSADQAQFAAMITDWRANTLTLYRGFPGCHFCWPNLLAGELRSEGDDDDPTFTMGGSTRWLPTADLNIAQGVSIQCTDVFTQQLSLSEPIPIGFTVAIPAGKNTNLPLCWLNPGEIAVRGPLRLGDYRMHSIAWLDVDQVAFRPWPHQIPGDTLLPARPYNPGRPITLWWESSQFWIDLVATYDATLQLAAARRAAAALVRQRRQQLLAAI